MIQKKPFVKDKGRYLPCYHLISLFFHKNSLISAKCTLRYNVRKTDIAYSFLFGMQLQNVFIFLPIKSCTNRLLSVIFQKTTRFLHRLYQILYLIIKQTCLLVKDFKMVFSYIFLNMSLILLKVYFYIHENEYNPLY